MKLIKPYLCVVFSIDFTGLILKKNPSEKFEGVLISLGVQLNNSKNRLLS